MDFNLVQSYILKLPEVSQLKNIPKVKDIIINYSESLVDEYLQKIIDIRHKKIVNASSEKELSSLDFSFDYYVENLKSGLVVENGRPLKKVVNCLGTIYSKYIGDRFYPEEVIKNFETVFKGYNNLEFEEEKGSKIEIDDEIGKMFTQISGDKGYLLTNSLGSALFLIIDTLFREHKVIMGLRDNVFLPEKLGFQDIILKARGDLKTVGYINRVAVEDYIKEIETGNELLIYTDVFENDIKGLQKLSKKETEKLNAMAKTLLITNKVYCETSSKEIKDLGNSIKEVLNNNYSLNIFDFSKLVGGPNLGIIVGDKELIKNLDDNFMARVLSPNKESKVLLYYTLKLYSEKKSNKTFLNRIFSMKSSEIKERNRRFMRNLEREVGNKSEINIIKGNYLTLDDGLSDTYTFERELIYVKPLIEDAKKIEKELRMNDPSILCWLNEGALIFNLQLIEEEDEGLIIDLLSEIL